MDHAQVELLLPLFAQAERDDIKKLLSYPDHSAGSIMTTEYASLRADMPVKDALEHIGATFVPVGTGASEKLVMIARTLRANALHCTPSYAAYLADYVHREARMDPRELGFQTAQGLLSHELLLRIALQRVVDGLEPRL